MMHFSLLLRPSLGFPALSFPIYALVWNQSLLWAHLLWLPVQYLFSKQDLELPSQGHFSFHSQFLHFEWRTKDNTDIVIHWPVVDNT